MNRIITIFFMLLFLAGCGRLQTASETPPEEPPEQEAVIERLPTGRPYIAIITRDKNHQFWNTVADGARDAAEKYGADFMFDGPAQDATAGEQADILSSVLAENPSAVCIATIDAQALASQLDEAKNEGIHIVGLNSGEEDMPGSAAIGVVSTDNYMAGQLAASSILGSPFLIEKIRNASAANPVTIAVISQSAETEAVAGRIQGFLDKASGLIQDINASGAQIKGSAAYERFRDGAAVTLAIITPAGAYADDNRAASLSALENYGGLAGVFCVSQSAAEGLLAATADGADLDKTRGKYKDLFVVGFDAGAKQKDAVRKQYFLGSVTQDPYAMGYASVELAYNALQGDTVPEAVDTGSRFYTYENIEKKEIARLLYD